MKKIYTLIISVMMISSISHAQVAGYYFTQENLTYSEINGGTSLWSGAFDDEVSGAITIPSFTFDGNAYTSIYVSANGFITFGIPPQSNTYLPISATESYAGSVSAFGRDLVHATTGSPAIRYEQVGNEFVIQWKDLRRKNIASEIISFQVRLNTSNNYIQVVYGGTITPGTSSSYPQVGLRGPDNTYATNVNNRTIATGGGSWVNSTKGTTNSSTMVFTFSYPLTVPSVGLTYTWKPLHNPSNFTATAISTSQIDLSWQKNWQNHNVMLAFNTTTTFGTPTNGQVYSVGNTIGGAGTVLFYGDTTNFSHNGLSPNTVYYYKIWSYDGVLDYSTGVTANNRTANALPYLQAFSGTSLPAGWTGANMNCSTAHGIAGTSGLYGRLNTSTPAASAVTLLVGSITSSTNLSFHYRIVDYLGYPYNATTPGPGDVIEIQASLDDGVTFTTFHTIDLNNHTTTTQWVNKVLSLAAYNTDFIKIRFLCTWASGDYYVDIDNVLVEDGTNMSYSGATTEQPNTSNLIVNSTNNEIIRLNVITQKSSNPLSVTSITMNMTGSTNAGTDIAAAKVFYTTGTTFSTATQFGTTINNPSGTLTFTGSQALAQGNNFFWLAYDIKSTATPGNVVDGQCTKFRTSEIETDKIPSSTSPSGTRRICTEISGTKTVSNTGSPDYSSIAAAVAALNNSIIGSGGVTFNVAAGHTETYTAEIILTATGTASNPIIFQKSGEGANPLITAGIGTTTNRDGIIKIAGGDFITFDGIDVFDPASNTTPTTQMEWGYALTKKQGSYPFDGCQNVTIKNCTITLQKANPASAGIYSGNHIATAVTELSITTVNDAMNNCKFFSNTISNVYTGIKLSGFDSEAPYTLYDHGNEIGVSGGNTITNFAGAATAANVIYTIYQSGIQIANNVINGGTNTTAVLYGIYNHTASSASADIYENTVTLTPSGTTSAFYGIYNTAGSTAAGNTININNNDIINCAYTSATSGAFKAVTSTATATTVNIYGNTISDNTLAGTGAFTAIDGGAPVNLNIYLNTLEDNQKTGTGGGNFTMIYSGATGTVSIHDNGISNNTLAGTGLFTGIDGGSPTNLNIYLNTLNNNQKTGASTNMTMINYTGAGTTNVNGNSISNNILAGTGNFFGITGGNVPNVNIYENEIFGNQKSGASGYMYLVKPGVSMIDCYDNEIYNNSFTNSSGTTGCYLYGYHNDASATSENIHNNNIYSLSIQGTNTSTSSRISGIFSSTIASAIKNIYQNNIYDLNMLAGYVHGITQELGTTVKIYKNNLYDLTTQNTGGTVGVTGIQISSGANVYVYNNFISDLQAPVSASSDAIRGISSTSGQANSTIGVYYNSIYLNASSSGAAFGNSGVYHTSNTTATTAALDLRNNIIVNNSAQNGTNAYAVAFRRSSSSRNNYMNSSDNNIYYAGTPELYHYVYHDGFAACQTMDSLRTLLGPTRDSLSFTEIPPFINTTTTPYNLRLQNGAVSHCESGGEAITSPVTITDDFDGATRSTPPDIGADEFAGISAYVEKPLAFSSTPHNSQGIRLNFTLNPDEDDIIIVFNSTGNFTEPSGAPVQGEPLAGGTVCYIGTTSPFIHTGLTPGIRVYYKIFSYNGVSYSNGLKTNNIPSVMPVSNVIATGELQTQIDLGWTNNPSGHNVMIVTNTISVMGAPINGTAYEVGNTLPGSGGTVIFNGPASAFSHTGLTQWTQRYYRLWAVDEYNYYSTFVATSGITNSNPITAYPHLEGFDLSWSLNPASPRGWNVVDVGGSGGDTWKRYETNPHSTPASARGYGGGTMNDYLISPPLVLPDNDLQISWWDIVTNASLNSYKVLLSTTTKQPASFTVELGDFQCTNTTWQQHSIDLSAYKGTTVYIAFYHYFSSNLNDFFRIDDFLIETYLPGPATDPMPEVDLLTMVNPNLRWTAPLSSFPVTGYKVYYGTTSNPATLAYDGPNASFQMEELDYNTTYYWKVLPYNSYGEAIDVPVWSFTTVTSTQLSESFEGNRIPPPGWMHYGWIPSDDESYHGNLAARCFTYPYDPYQYLATPLLEIEEGDNLEFFVRASKINNYIRIAYSAEKVKWIDFEIFNYIPVGEWERLTVNLDDLAGGNYYLRIEVWCAWTYWDYFYIDHITGPDIVPLLPEEAVDPNPFDFDTYVSTTPTLSWNCNLFGGIPDGYKVYLDTDPDPSTLIYNGEDPQFNTNILLYNTSYYWKVVPYNDLGDASDCPVWTFTTMPEDFVQIGDGSSVYYYLPIVPSTDYSYTQTIYLQSEIDIPGSRLTKIYYEWDGAYGGGEMMMSGVDGYPAYTKDWVIYMGHTEKVSFDSLTDWIDMADLTEVFNGEVILPANYTWIEIELDVPFEYNNLDNLVIAVDENSPGSFPPESVYFYGTNDPASRAIVALNYETNPDPSSPPQANTMEEGFANIRMQFEGNPTEPLLRVIPDSYEFGFVKVNNDSDPKTFTIRNNGIGILTIYNVAITGTDAGQFDLTDLNTYSVDLGANEFITVDVTFSPTSEGLKDAYLTITHNLTGSPKQVPLSGTGVDLVVDTFPFTETFEDDSPTRILWTQIQELGDGLWTYASGTGIYNSINEAHGGVLNARFTDVGGNTTKLVSPVIDLTSQPDPYVTFWYGQEYYGVPYQNELKVYYRTASDQPWVEIFYDDMSVDLWTPHFLALPNPSSTYQIAFEGIDQGGFANVLDDITVGPEPDPVLTIDPGTYDFGPVWLNDETYQVAFEIKNTGPGLIYLDLTYIEGMDESMFIIEDLNDYPVLLDFDESIYVYVSFLPTSEGLKHATLTVEDDTPSSPHQAALIGTGIDPVITSFPFHETFENDSPTRDLWTQIEEYGYASWSYATGAGRGSILTAHDGSLNAQFWDIGSEYITKLVTPILDLTGVPSPQLEFWYGQEEWAGDQNYLFVYYRTADDQPWEEIFYDYWEQSEWTQVILSLPEPSATYQLAFEAEDYFGYANVLDDVRVSAGLLTTTWHGNVSEDWLDPANWSDGVPTAEHAVIIDSQLHDPEITTTISVYSVTIETASYITITPPGVLTVTGN